MVGVKRQWWGYSTDLSRNKWGSLITPACSDAITDAEVANFGVLSPEGMTADLPPRPMAFAIVSFIPAHSRNRHLTSWFCTGRNLATGDPAGFLLLTTRPTRDGAEVPARTISWRARFGYCSSQGK